MTKEQILEGNKLIACFDGWEHSGRGGNLSNYYYKDNRKQQSHSDDFEYYTSWDWLIPVLEKIEQLGYHTRICFDDFGSWMQIHYGLSVADTMETKALNQHGTKIENTFKSVVEFIKWYNKNGKPSRKK